MAYSIEVKNEVKERLNKGEKAKDISKEMGISLPTIYRWKIQLKYEAIKKSIIGEEEPDEPKVDLKKKHAFLNEMKTKLYFDKISEQDIENIKHNEDLSEDEKVCILLAIYQKQRNAFQVENIVKKYKAENPESKYNKQFNIILQKSQSKKTQIFDFGIYDKLLNWQMDKELVEVYIQEQKNEEKNRIQSYSREPKVIKQKETASKVDSNNKKVTTPKVTSNNKKAMSTSNRNRKSFKERMEADSNQVIVTPVPKEEKRVVNYYKKIMDYLLEKEAWLYASANINSGKISKNAIEQLDKMEILIEKVKNNRNNEQYLEELYEKISRLEGKQEYR